MLESLIKTNNVYLNHKMLNSWYEKLDLSVAPACNMMCNFCTKSSSCICNGNNPEYLSRSMTPRQAVNWALASAKRNRRIKILKISGPGEPLFNNQTFEVLKRLNVEMPEHIYCINTNGLLLEEKVNMLANLNVKMVEVSMNAYYSETVRKLYSRVINDKGFFSTSAIADEMIKSQINGIKLSKALGIDVRLNIIYFPGINDEDIAVIASKCREWKIKSITLISCCPNGKMAGLRAPSIEELSILQHKLSLLVDEVEIKSFSHQIN